MRYTFDHDLHIHSNISPCAKDPIQTPQTILQYAIDNKLNTVCITDHFWDEAVTVLPENWYKSLNLERISSALPLPQADGVRFLFGCETDIDRTLALGVAPEHFDAFDFIVVPTTHMHMTGFTMTLEEGATAESRAKAWVKRLDALLAMDLPFHKIGIAHLVCGLIAPASREMLLEVLSLIPDAEMERLFKKAASLGVGIELNRDDGCYTKEEAPVILRPFRIAKDYGCKFYLGSDAHHPKDFVHFREVFERAVRLLELKESDKFMI